MMVHSSSAWTSDVRGQFRDETGTGPELDQSWLTDNRKRVMGRTWLQLICCVHSYDMWVCPINLERRLESGVRQRSDRGWTEVWRKRISWKQDT